MRVEKLGLLPANAERLRLLGILTVEDFLAFTIADENGQALRDECGWSSDELAALKERGLTLVGRTPERTVGLGAF